MHLYKGVCHMRVQQKATRLFHPDLQAEVPMMRLIEFILKFEQRCFHLVYCVAFRRAAIDT